MLFKHILSFNVNLNNNKLNNIMSKSSFIIALSSFSTKKQAKKISKDLIEGGFAACVNIIDNVESIYKWKGKIVSEKEILVVIKTIHSNREKLKKFIRDHHEYENPELIFISIEDGSKEYLKWLEKEIKLK